ncbi:hypothetical protein D5086_008875 [Populus alba]|uniref:Uncharacterized protein n=1 Tax=Populus alba TaxID=43335 RepID=A0ACC4CH50_POPAL
MMETGPSSPSTGAPVSTLACPVAALSGSAMSDGAPILLPLFGAPVFNLQLFNFTGCFLCFFQSPLPSLLPLSRVVPLINIKGMYVGIDVEFKILQCSRDPFPLLKMEFKYGVGYKDVHSYGATVMDNLKFAGVLLLLLSLVAYLPMKNNWCISRLVQWMFPVVADQLLIPCSPSIINVINFAVVHLQCS